MNIKLTNNSGNINLNVEQKKGRLQIKKRIYNKTFKSFIEDKYGSGIHFGNMDSNLEEILKNLSIDHIMECSVRIPKIDLNTLSKVNNKKNEFSDFDLYDSFECTFLAKENVSSEEFAKGIDILQKKLLDTYNQKVHDEILEREYENRLQIKKRELKEITFFIILAVVALVLIYFFTLK
ncbi:hypothetical protein C8N46_102301 [Kordia periserrulae]|uniref:Uncharacterized protein n=1 Tax=Kordia periserrulae TaxID=701523 RepID=A0A2T6C3K3_9FLAO|nr:hypothetical protein [Kordia periserrulae]PTX62900.1 hypothetical protein C8N46_102301 [Kordia periserrulae]